MSANTSIHRPRQGVSDASSLHRHPCVVSRCESATRTGQRSANGRFTVAAWLAWNLVLAAASDRACGQDTPDYFRQNCASCHTIGGGRLTGPDLKDVTKRQTREWLANYLLNPKAVIDSGDAYAKKIFEESRGVPMPMPPLINPDRAQKLLDLIEAESKLEKSQFVGLQVSTAPFTDEDRARGHEIYLGTRRLEKGGTACISCHNLSKSAALGGGRLGPDLTNVYERLKGRAALSAWLMAPGTETMQPTFRNHPLSPDEIQWLVAFFESIAAQSPADPSRSQVSFLLAGLAGAVAGVFFLDSLWKKRFHSVRRSLVDANTARGKS